MNKMPTSRSIVIVVLLAMLTTMASSRKKKYRSTSSDTDTISSDLLSLGLTSESVSTSSSYSGGKKRHRFRGFDIKGYLRKQFTYLVVQHRQQNMVCSPISALLPLGKLALGAEGDTFRELAIAIGVHSKSEVPGHFRKILNEVKSLQGVTLSIASRLYLNENKIIKSRFLEDATRTFHSCVEQVDFSRNYDAVGKINSWVTQETHGKIRDIVSPSHVNANTSIIIVNAVYFMGRWKIPFQRLKEAPFFSPTGQRNVQYMISEDNRYRYYKSSALDAQIISIPYEKMRVALMVVLPSRRDGLPTLINQLKIAPEILKNAVEKLTVRTIDHLGLPKFHIETELDLKTLYEKLGVRKTFTYSSNLQIVDNDKVLISRAIQKAYIDVNEWGTKASAASALDLKPISYHGERITFLADRPFMFFIIGKDHQLFSGTVVTP